MSNPIQIVEADLAALSNKVEAKVKAASTAAAVAGLALSVLGTYVFKGTAPEWLVAPIDAVVAGGLAFLAGFIAKHTPRTGGKPAPAPVAPVAPPAPPAAS